MKARNGALKNRWPKVIGMRAQSGTSGWQPAIRDGRGARLCPVLIGRDDLLALADRRMSATLAGSGELLFLAGEAGVGKTRLLTEITDRATGRGFAITRAGAFPRDAEVAGGVLTDLATDLQRSPDPATAEAGVRMAGRLREGGDPGGDAYRRRRLLVADLAEAITSVAAAGDPVLLALEDLHWADDLTLEVLDRAARHLGGLRMLVVGTYRSDELYPRVPMRTWRTRLLTQRLAEEVRLPRLGRDDTAAMAAAITGTVLRATVSSAVFERSDGIPLHVEELLAAISGKGVTAEVPDTLADAVLTRAQDLTERSRVLAAAAAVIGRSFDLDLLTAVTNESPQVIDAGLRELCDRFFIQPQADGSVYDFRHALIRDALYADLTPHRRRDLHAQVAAAAQAAGFGDAFISDQCERAHQPALAYRHALAAGTEATAMSAHREAVELYRRAQRTTPASTPAPELAELLTALASELAAIDDNLAAAATYNEAYLLRRGLGHDTAAAALVPALVAARHLRGADLDERTSLLRDALSLIDSATDKSTQDTRVRILAALSAAYMLDRRLDEAIEHGEHAHSLAAGLGDQCTRLNIDATLGSVLVFAGRMDEGWQHLHGAIEQANDARAEAEAARSYRMIGSCASVLVEYDRGLHWLREGIAYAERTERFNDRHYMAAHLAHVLWATGDWPAADREASHALADGRGGITTRVTALHVLGYLALGRGEWPIAYQHLGEAHELGAQMRELQRLSPALWGLAEAALHNGRSEEAVAWCEKGYAASAEVHDAAYLFPYVVTGTRAYLALDDPAGARHWVDRSEQLLLLRGIPGTLPALHHAHGLLHLHDGHTGKAREALEHASAGWDKRHRFWEGTQALLDRARCATRSRRPAEATALAGQARDRATAAGATTMLIAAEHMLTDGPSHQPDDNGSPLTAREIEIARHVATGATNRQIAQTLSIAPKTVAAHIEHILTKLGAARRTEIATWSATRTTAR
jgi:DNA-binding CsgD family transcriptional regulator/tetratricopeptide (TPR) repeat protein